MGKFKHGFAPRGRKSRTYLRWEAMIRRCKYPNQQMYYRYGGRGIAVCPEWLDFCQFLQDMGECPEGMTLDRIDSDGNYEPGNCRWADIKTQQRNRAGNNLIAFNGEIMCLTEWAERIGVHPKTLRARIYDHHWSIEKSLTTPIRRATISSQVWHNPSDSKAVDVA